ncbi:hypothetical protein ACU4GD_19810 [Cupriavidus basilensis]
MIAPSVIMPMFNPLRAARPTPRRKRRITPPAGKKWQASARPWPPSSWTGQQKRSAHRHPSSHASPAFERRAPSASCLLRHADGAPGRLEIEAVGRVRARARPPQAPAMSPQVRMLVSFALSLALPTVAAFGVAVPAVLLVLHRPGRCCPHLGGRLQPCAAPWSLFFLTLPVFTFLLPEPLASQTSLPPP